MIHDLSFPIIAFAKDGSMLAYPTLEALTHCPRQALRNGYFVGLSMVDSQGRAARVQYVQQGRRAGGVAQKVTDFLSGKVQVELTLAPETPAVMPLHELKTRVIDGLEAWCDADAAEEMLQAVEAARSYEAMIRLLCDG